MANDSRSTVATGTVHSPPERIIEAQLDEHIVSIEDCVKGYVLSFFGSLLYGTEDVFRDATEALVAERRIETEKLVVILETDGGYIEVVERIAKILRHHFKRVEFIIPNYAMSAGTVLAMCGDAIHMDYFSVLGPIDPQVRTARGESVPALGYLAQYERLIQKASEGELSTAELAFLVQKFDPAELYRYEQARELSISLLKEWLVEFKFKEWRKTETTGKSVTITLKKRRAESIARKLNDSAKWHSHARGISMEVLRKDLNLKIEDFGEHKELSDKVRVYYKLLTDYMLRLRQAAALHRKGSYVQVK